MTNYNQLGYTIIKNELSDNKFICLHNGIVLIDIEPNELKSLVESQLEVLIKYEIQ